MFRKKALLLLIPALIVALVSFKYTIQKGKDEAIDLIMLQNLNNNHYSPMAIDDKFAEKVFDLYLKRLDYYKKFFIQSDIHELKKFEHKIDDDVKDSKFTFFDKSIELLNKRIDESQKYYQEILEKPFVFTKDETVELDAEKLTFAKNKEELKEAWRKSLKYQVLSKMVDMQETQEKEHEKSDTVKIKSKEELEVEARKKVLKSNDDWFKRLRKLDHNDRIAMYYNAVTGVYDPHTEFFPPKEKANFDIGMSGQLEGIGAQLQEKDGAIKVSNIVAGSASYRQGQLKAGDIILKVAQGDAEPVDVTDMRMDDAVQLIRGKKGTEVRLTVKKPDASVIIIPIIRDIVVLEETFAQSALLKAKKNIGYIKLPSFYADFNGVNGRSCAKDVRKEVMKLKDENVDGIILDLRYNGGGSLADAVNMAGLFIDKGPIVQVRSRTDATHVMDDRDPALVYDGPLVVLINSNSASASEILAAAMQDYKRAVIVGTSPSSFGKGTVQRFFDLDDYLPAQYDTLKPLGQVKVTTQKFYRINGGATQLKGVTPDITLPDPYYLLDQGEKEQDYPMAWDEIAPASYQVMNQTYSIDKLKANSEARQKNNDGFETLSQAAKRLKKQKDSTIVSLNFDIYAAQQKRIKEESKKMEDFDKEIPGLDIASLKVDAIAIEGDTTKMNKAKDWFKNLKKDIYLHETVAIIEDMK